MPKVPHVPKKKEDKSVDADIPFGEPIHQWSDNMKCVVWGMDGTGKTTFAVRTAKMYPDKNVIVFNSETLENLRTILKAYPDVARRTRISPTREQMNEVKKQGKKYDEKGYTSGQELALAEFLQEEILKFCNLDYDTLQNWIVIVDTASEIANEMKMKIKDEIDMEKISMAKSRFAYGEPRRKFETMISRLMKLPTHAVVTGRAEPIGIAQKTQKGMEFKWTDEEQPQWETKGGGKNKRKSSVWYDATTIIHLKKKEVYLKDETGSYIPKDKSGRIGDEYKTKILRWAELVKHKAPINSSPVFFNPAPWDVFGWIEKQSKQGNLEK